MKKKKDNDNNQDFTIAPEIFLKSVIFNFKKASTSFFTLAEWGEALLFIKEMADKQERGEELTTEEYKKLAISVALYSSYENNDDDIISKAMNNIDDAVHSLQLISKIDINKEGLK